MEREKHHSAFLSLHTTQLTCVSSLIRNRIRICQWACRNFDVHMHAPQIKGDLQLLALNNPEPYGYKYQDKWFRG